MIAVTLTVNVYYLTKLVAVKAIPRTVIYAGWISFLVTLLVCYYHLTTFLETNGTSINLSGWVIIAFLYSYKVLTSISTTVNYLKKWIKRAKRMW